MEVLEKHVLEVTGLPIITKPRLLGSAIDKDATLEGWKSLLQGYYREDIKAVYPVDNFCDLGDFGQVIVYTIKNKVG